jgi:hypothetical protein
VVEVFFRGYGAWLVWEDAEASYPVSERYRANGVFCLTTEDEIKCRHTGNLNGIDTLCSSKHPDSEFKKALERGMFAAELARLAEAAQLQLGSELVDLKQIHSTLANDARFYFDARKEMPLVLVKPDNKPTTHNTKNDKKPVTKETAQTNNEHPALTVETVTKKAPLESTSRISKKVMAVRSDLIPSEGFVKLEQIIGNKKKGIPAIIPISRSTFLKRVKDGIYPQLIRLGLRSVAWSVDDIRKLIESLKT